MALSDAAMADAPHAILGREIGPARRRGWTRPGLTVHLAKYDRTAPIGDVGCYHVLRGDGKTLCGRLPEGPGWRDAGWADSEVVCCRHCAVSVWRRWTHGEAEGIVAQEQAYTVSAHDNWPAQLGEEGRRAVETYLRGQRDR